MEINIVKKNTGDLLRKNKTKWGLAYRNTYFFIASYAFVGSLILICNAVTAKNADDFWGLGTSLGGGLIFLSIVYFSHTFQAKRKYLERTRIAIKRSEHEGQNTEILIKDDGITFKDFQTRSEWKWSVFPHYLLYKDYLFLMMGNSVLNSITIQKTELSVYEFEELINFCKGHLYLKK
jgi:hypothetical protein